MNPIYVRSEKPLIQWTPDDEQTAKDAVSAVCGPVDSFPVSVTDETAEQIRSEYSKLKETL